MKPSLHRSSTASRSCAGAMASAGPAGALRVAVACAVLSRSAAPTVDITHSVAYKLMELLNETTALRDRWKTSFNATDNTTRTALRFPAPNCATAASYNATEMCVVEDLSYCDEFTSLDTDCNGLMTAQELSFCETMDGYESMEDYINLDPRAYVRMLVEERWTEKCSVYDRDLDGNLTLVDWLAMRGQYVHTFSSCGEAMRDPRYSEHKRLPIKPCPHCAENWVSCWHEYGGGWNLVYEIAGRVDMRTQEERNPRLLFTTGWQRAERSSGVLVDALPSDAAAQYAAAGGKLADIDIKHLCNGQYAIVQPGRPPQFCAFEDVNNYADDEPNVKFCAKRYHSKGWYDKYDVAKVDDELPSESAAHGFSTGTAVTGNVILQLSHTGADTTHRYADESKRGAAPVWPAIDVAGEPTEALHGYAPTQGCTCKDSWQRNGVAYTDGGCHRPDENEEQTEDEDLEEAAEEEEEEEELPWCMTKLRCGLSAAAKGADGFFAYCVDRCEGGEGCPAQVWCRDNATVPKLYIAPEADEVLRSATDALQFFFVVTGFSFVIVLGGGVIMFSKLRKFKIGFELPPRCALVTATFSADTLSTQLQMSVTKGDLVQVLEYVSWRQQWWKVREPHTRKEGFVPTRCLKMVSREEEHMYQAGVVWAGSLAEDRANRRKQLAEADGNQDRIPAPEEMDLFQLKNELRQRGYLNPRGDVRRLRAALARMIRDDEEAADTKQDRLPPCDGELTVVIVSCSGLIAGSIDEGGLAGSDNSCNPLVSFWIGDEQRNSAKTKTMARTTSPQFDTTFTFKIDHTEAPDNESLAEMRQRVTRVVNQCVLSVNVWDAPSRKTNLLRSNNFIGEVQIDFVKEFGKEWLTKTVQGEWRLADPDYRVARGSRERRLKEQGAHFHDQLDLGRLVLTARFKKREKRVGRLDNLFLRSSKLNEQESRLDSEAKRGPIEVCSAGHKLHRRVADGLLSTRRAQLAPCDGVIHVSVLWCSRLPEMLLDRPPMPIVQLAMGDDVVQVSSVPFLDSTAAENTPLQAAESFSFRITGGSLPAACLLSVAVMDGDPERNNVFGSTVVDLCTEFDETWLSEPLTRSWSLYGPNEAQVIEEAVGSTQLRPDSQASKINGAISMMLHFVESSESAAELGHGRLQRLFRTPSAPAEDSRASDLHGGGGALLERESLLRSTRNTVSRHADELAQEYCSHCGTLVAIGDFLWECSGGCDFLLCELCAAQEEVPTGIDSVDAGKVSLADRIDAALAPECKDTTMMQSLVDECTTLNYEHPQAFALRSKLAANSALRGLAVPPPMSPAEGRRRVARGLEPFSGRRQRNAALRVDPAEVVETEAEDHQVTGWIKRLNELRLPPPLSRATRSESKVKPPPLDVQTRAVSKDRRTATLEVAFL